MITVHCSWILLLFPWFHCMFDVRCFCFWNWCKYFNLYTPRRASFSTKWNDKTCYIMIAVCHVLLLLFLVIAPKTMLKVDKFFFHYVRHISSASMVRSISAFVSIHYTYTGWFMIHIRGAKLNMRDPWTKTNNLCSTAFANSTEKNRDSSKKFQNFRTNPKMIWSNFRKS